jgi:thiol-disulfide isomerase/thioredoxin
MSDYLKYLPFVLIGGGTLLQLYIHFAARRMRGRKLSELDGLLTPEWLEKKKLLIYFSSPYCAPCKAIAPLIDKLSSESGNILKLDAIEHGELASRLGARGAPAFVQVRQGRVVKVHLGSLSETKLRQMV